MSIRKKTVRRSIFQQPARAGERRWRANPSARQGVDHRPGFDVSDQGKSGCRADNTYGNEEMLRWLDDRGITPYIRVKEGPNSPPDLYGIEKFTYVPEENCYLCPAGKPLNYVGINKRNRAHRYYSTVKRCRGCGPGRRHHSGALGSPQFPVFPFFNSNALWFSISLLVM